MSSIGAAPRVAVPPPAPGAAFPSPARAEASRRNGARSRGPKTPEGKARSAQNALKHGFRAQKHIVLPGEDAAAFEALEAALMEELAPVGALQSMLAQRVVAAAWRLERAERLEAELFAENHLAGGSLGLALIRDCNGARSFDTLLRYRGGTLAELWRALRTLKALQAERAAQAVCEAAAGPAALPGPDAASAAPETPIEPEADANPGEIASLPAADKPEAPCRRTDAGDAACEAGFGGTGPCRGLLPQTLREMPIQPEGRAKPCGIAPLPAADIPARNDADAGPTASR